MNLDNLDLRSLIRRIAWKRIALIAGVILLLRFVLLHGWYFRMLYMKTLMLGHTITMPFHSIGDTSHNTYDVLPLMIFCITVLGITKLLMRQRQ